MPQPTPSPRRGESDAKVTGSSANDQVERGHQGIAECRGTEAPEAAFMPLIGWDIEAVLVRRRDRHASALRGRVPSRFTASVMGQAGAFAAIVGSGFTRSRSCLAGRDLGVAFVVNGGLGWGAPYLLIGATASGNEDRGGRRRSGIMRG